MGKSIKFFVVIILVLAGFSLSAQVSSVSGTAKGGEGKRILVKTMDDYLSGKEQLLASSIIDSNGHFSLSFPLKRTIYAWFEIDYYEGEMYLVTGFQHHFTLKGLVFNDQTDKINVNLEQLTVSVIPDSSDQLNVNIRRFNQMSNRVLIANMDNLMSKKFRRSLDSLQRVSDSVFAAFQDPYFSAYTKYRMASLYLMNAPSGTNGLFFRYLYHQPVLYDNIEYMSFFRQYYDDYFAVVNRPFSSDQLRFMVNSGASFPALLDSVGVDTLLQNEVLREMVLLETLDNLQGETGYKKENVRRLLTEFSNSSKFEIHRRIAANILEESTRFEKGSRAADFALADANGDTVRLSELRDKPVYLHFFTTWNTASLEEMEMMRKLYDKYSGTVRFISICCDREYMKMYHFARDHKYPWPLLHFNGDYALLRSLNVKTIPYFILIDPKGCYVSNPALSPSSNVEGELRQLLGVE